MNITNTKKRRVPALFRIFIRGIGGLFVYVRDYLSFSAQSVPSVLFTKNR